ncbi:MAG: 2OG-Fe dioxygenase family protein [Pseudomonadota bacterium]|nr:2OG-Fe dioxygenase family protein [Pseudomonadota bacterium]
MSGPPFAAPITVPAEAATVLRQEGYVVLDPPGFAALCASSIPELDALRESWADLPADTYLRDGGRYRRRRHSCFVVTGDAVDAVPRRAHWQPLEYNALHGGLERWFEPIDPAVLAKPAWTRLLRAMAGLASALKGEQAWFVEAHQFRIDTTDGIGRPTPEGAHRDGVDLVAVVLVGREGIKGGETRVFDADGPTGVRFTMQQPWTCLLLDDARVIHESTPIQPLEGYGHRDTLVLTLRTGGFQGPG